MKTQATQDAFLLLGVCEGLWAQMLVNAQPVVHILSVHTHLGDVLALDRRSGDLFEDLGPDEVSARERASQVMDQINARYGAGSLRIGEEQAHPGFFERG